MSAPYRFVVVARWYGEQSFPPRKRWNQGVATEVTAHNDAYMGKAQCLGFVVTHAPDVTPWQEQIRRIAAYVPHAARWEVIPVPNDVDERGVLMAAGNEERVS